MRNFKFQYAIEFAILFVKILLKKYSPGRYKYIFSYFYFELVPQFPKIMIALIRNKNRNSGGIRFISGFIFHFMFCSELGIKSLFFSAVIDLKPSFKTGECKPLLSLPNIGRLNYKFRNIIRYKLKSVLDLTNLKIIKTWPL